MGTQYRRRSLSPAKELEVSDDDESFILGSGSESEFSDDYYSEESTPQLPSPFQPKDPRSKAKYNIFSRLFFLWLEPLFWLGCQRELDYSNLYVHPSEADSERLLQRFNRYWAIEQERKRHGGKARLMVALMKCFWWRLVLQGLSILVETAILVCQSIVLGLLTDYFSIEAPTSEDTKSAYLYALGLVLMTILVIMMHSHSFLMGQKMSMIARIITTGAIYKKILSLSQVEIAQVSIGHIINLASNDVQRFDPAFPHFPYLWVAPLHLVAFTYLVYREFGWSVFLASGFLLLQIPLQIGMAKLFVYLRFKSARLTDKRVRIMNEIISGIRVIKMYAWENAFKKVISRLRKNESFIIFQGAIIRACTLANMIVSISIIMWLMMTAYVGSGGEPNTRQVFTTLSLLTSLRLSTYFFVLAILGYSEGQVAISRIQNLLELETDSGSPNKSLEDFSYVSLESEDFTDRVNRSSSNLLTEEKLMNGHDPRTMGVEEGTPSPTSDDMIRASVESLSASWSYQRDKTVLQNVTLEVNQDIPLLAIVGPVGSGKSTLLQCLLGELKPISGKVEVKGKLSYVAQEPWMFMGTIRDNILFGMAYEPIWYNKVIEACSLDEDFKQLPYGDLTLVGERGVTLSGGQKARVNLARAVYHDADIFLLDDPLSAVDAAVAAHLFNNCIRGLLSEHLVILVTHQLQFALQANKILVVKEGCPELYGSCEELVSQGVDPNFLLGMIKNKEGKEDEDWASVNVDVTGSTPGENELLISQYNGDSVYKTPFEMMHDIKSASSDSDSADNSPSFQRFSIRTETPHPEQQLNSPIVAPVMNHTPSHSLTDISESEVEGTDLSPDFPKFRPGLLSELHRSDIDTTSPDFPKFRPGLLAQQNSDAKNSSSDFPKFRPGLLPQQNPDTNTTSPDFPKFRTGLLSQQNQANTSTSSDFRPGLSPQHDQENSNVSPDFPKFRPGLLNGHPTADFFKLRSPPAGHQRRSNLQSRSDFRSSSASPGSPISPPGYITPHLKCPVSPLARTSAQARFPRIRSILKPPTGGQVLVNQQTRPMGSPLMRRVLQHNADRLLMRKGTMATIDDQVEDSKTLLDQPNVRGVTSPTSSPYMSQTTLINYTTENLDTELQTSPSHECTDSEKTPQSVDNLPPSAMQSPLTSPTDWETKVNTGTPQHEHFAGEAIEERLDEEIDGESNSLNEEDTSPLLAGPSAFCLPPTPPTNQAAVPSKATTPSPLLYHQDNRPIPSASVSPKIPMRYSRRKSVTFEGEHMHTGPLRLYHSRKSPLSPISSGYNKRRRSISTVGHKQKGEHHNFMLTPSPHLPSHVYRKVSLSPSQSRPFNRKQPPLNQTQQDSVKVPSPHLPSHVYRNVPLYMSSINYKRRRSVSILTRHEADQSGTSLINTRHNKRRKSVSILTHRDTGISPLRHKKRRKSVSILTREEGDHKVTSSRYQKRRKSLSVVNPEVDHSRAIPVNSMYYAAVTHHEGYYNNSFPANSRHHKRRRSESIMSQYQHDKHMVPSPHLPVHVYRHTLVSPESIIPGQNDEILNIPMSPMNYKRRRSIVSVGQEQNNEHRALTPKSPRRFFRKHLPSPFIFGRNRRRKSVLVINQDDHLIPLTSPMFNRITLGAYQRSLPSTPMIPRRFARRKSLSVITPRTRRRVESDEQIQVTMEAARFDVTSIYSSKSFLSLAPTTISREKSAVKKRRKDSEAGESPPELTEEEKGEGSISMNLYYRFFRAGGSILLLLALIAVFIVGEVGVVISDWWLSDWADCSSQGGFVNDTMRSTCHLSPSQRIGIYTFTTMTAVLLNFGRAILFYFICLRASYVLHNQMFSAVLRTFVQFFDNNPAGRILNRFSKDIGFLDDLLPYIFCEYLLLLLRCVAVIITAVASNPWVAIPAVILVIAFLALRWYYLRTSREVKRLEAIARSPVYSHIAITLHGLPMIRSLGQQHVMLEQFHTYQNQHSQGWYLYLVTVRWFGLRIDLLSSLFLVAVAFFSIPLASELNAGLVGLGLTYVISLADMLQYTIRLSADVENTMVSAERVISYGNLEPEAELDTHHLDNKPPPSWPDKGMITMEDVAFQYSSELPLVLKDLCFTIQPAEKVGVVGRTGAGKSSLISVLYRLVEPHGLVTIDGVDAKAIGLHDLRKKMSIIPQDPVLFSGTMRYNLDPFDEYADTELWEALEQVQLKSAVQQLDGQLEGEVSEGGSNFSVGQRQLVCLARALLRKNKILVLDEATANVDQRTDEVIQTTIREKFSDCTVIAIAHRLNTIMDSDKIMLLKKGKLREFDSPYNLLLDSTSKFYKMVEKTGPASSERLHQIALEAHLKKTFGSKSTRVPQQSNNKNGGSKITALVARTLLQRDTPLSLIEERRLSIISSNSFPCALNEIGTNAGMNANDPNLQNLRLPSDPNLSSNRSMYQQDDRETEAGITGSTDKCIV